MDRRLQELAAVGEIAQEIVHELRNALLVISASTYLAQKNPAGAAPHLQKVERHTRVAQSIVDGMMALARGESLPLEPTPLALVLASARGGTRGLGTFEDEVEGLVVMAHPTLLSRVFRCLYENAAQAAPPSGVVVRTSARLLGDRVVMTVSDDGPGVPELIRETLFEPLVTAREGGTGLGLALSRRIVAALGGEIGLSASDRGACFRLDLRAAPSPFPAT